MKLNHTFIIIIAVLFTILVCLVSCAASMFKTPATESTNTSANISESTLSTDDLVTIPDVESTYEDIEDVTTAPTRYEYEKEAVMLAKLLYREARGIKSVTEQANVAWVVLNRVDSTLAYYPDTIEEVIIQKNQFAWVENSPTVDDYGRDLVDLAQRIILFWAYGDDNGIIRTLPQNYFYFYGDGTHNHFTHDYDLFLHWCKTKNFMGEWDYSYGYLKEDVR